MKRETEREREREGSEGGRGGGGRGRQREESPCELTSQMSVTIQAASVTYRCTSDLVHIHRGTLCSRLKVTSCTFDKKRGMSVPIGNSVTVQVLVDDL